MATKKQKRERGIAKRKDFMAQVREAGLAAQQADHAERQKEREKVEAEVAEINRRHNATRTRIAAVVALLEARESSSSTTTTTKDQ